MYRRMVLFSLQKAYEMRDGSTRDDPFRIRCLLISKNTINKTGGVFRDSNKVVEPKNLISPTHAIHDPEDAGQKSRMQTVASRKRRTSFTVWTAIDILCVCVSPDERNKERRRRGG